MSARIAIYAGDVLGLGHVRRNVAIAARLVELCPDADVLILTNLPSVSPFELPRGVDVVKLPSVAKLDAGRYGAQALGLGQDQVLGLRAGMIESVVARFEPDLLLVDHLPAGIEGELVPALRAARSRPRPPRVVLGLRDILDDPEVTRSQWDRWQVYETIDTLYDNVLVYGSRSLFDTAAVYGLEERVSTPLSYCGYVCASGVAAAGARDVLAGEPPAAPIVVTAGGGADGQPILSTVIDALRRLPRDEVDGSLVVTGPFMSRPDRDALRERAEAHGLRVERFRHDLARCVASARLVVTMAGYNTLGEAARLGVRTLVIPRPGPSAEQRMRARLFLDRGLVTRVVRADASPGEIATAIEASLDAPAPAARLPEPDGRERVARVLAVMLEGRRTVRPVLRAETKAAP